MKHVCVTTKISDDAKGGVTRLAHIRDMRHSVLLALGKNRDSASRVSLSLY